MRYIKSTSSNGNASYIIKYDSINKSELIISINTICV